MNTLEAVFSAVIDTSWRASCLIVLVFGLRRWLRGRVAARVLFCVWLAVALRLLLPISVPSTWSPFNVAAWRHRAFDGRVSTAADNALAPAAARLAPSATPPPARAEAFSWVNRLSLTQWLALAWCGGVVALLLARAAAYRTLARKVRRSVVPAARAALPTDVAAVLEARGLPVCVTDAVSAPALHGMFRPRVLFPPGFIEKLSASEIRLTIAHELAHAGRHDLLADAILHLAVVVHWFNPLAWFAARAARDDCELACDERVVCRASETERERYGATLLTIARLAAGARRAGLGLGVADSKRHIQRRIHMILANPVFTRSRTLLCAGVFVAITGFSFTSETTAQVSPSAATAITPPAPTSPAPGRGAPAIFYNADVDRLDHLFPTGVVATINDRSITVADVRVRIAPLIPQLQGDARSQEEFDGRLMLLQKSVIKQLVDQAVLIRQFHDHRPGEQPRQIASEHIDAAIADEIAERFDGDRQKFLEYLRGRGLTQRDYRREVEESIIYNYMRSQERKIAGKTDAPKADPAERPIHLRMIQLNRAAGETDAALLAKANAILARFRSGESFAQLAREFDQSQRRARGGDWGWQGPADLRPDFRDVFTALQKGEVSAPILVPAGCFLFYAEDRR